MRGTRRTRMRVRVRMRGGGRGGRREAFDAQWKDWPKVAALKLVNLSLKDFSKLILLNHGRNNKM